MRAISTGRSKLAGAGSPRADRAMVHGGESILDGVRRAQVLPMLSGKVVECQQRVSIPSGTRPPSHIQLVWFDEPIEGSHGVRARWPDIAEHLPESETTVSEVELGSD